MNKIFLLFISLGLLASTNDCFSQEPKIDVDKNGNINIIGWFQDSLVFPNSETIYSNLPSFNNKRQNFLIHLDSNRRVTWYRLFEHESFYDFDVVSDDLGNVYLGGRTWGIVPLDSNIIVNDPTHGYILIKYDSIGNYKWYRKSTGIVPYPTFNLTIDRFNNLYFAGTYYKGPFSFGDTDILKNKDENAFIVKFDSSGIKQWIKELHGSADQVTDIDISGPGVIFFSGAFWLKEPAWFGDDTIYADGGLNPFIAKCDSEGNSLWIKAISSPGTSTALNIGASNNCSATIVGSFTQGIYFNNIPSLISQTEERSFFIINYDSLGHENWALKGAPKKPFPGDNLVSMDNNSNSWVVGRYPIILDDIQLEGRSGTFLVKFDSSGQYDCHPEINNSTIKDIFTDKSDYVYIIGEFADSMSIEYHTYTGYNNNIFIAKFDNNCNLVWLDVIKNKTEFIGTTEDISSSPIKVYPNPTTGNIYIDFISTNVLEGSIRIYSITGALLINNTLNKGSQEVDVSYLSKGIYLLEIAFDGKIVIERIVKY